MSNDTICPRKAEIGASMMPDFEFENKPDDGTCDFCGSLLPDIFMQRIENGDVTLDPTDKDYKVYVHNNGGEAFLQASRTDKPSQIGEILKDPNDQSLWTWQVKEQSQTKFYFQHLSEDQKKQFVELMNEKKIKLNEPGHFYRMPFFMTDQRDEATP